MLIWGPDPTPIDSRSAHSSGLFVRPEENPQRASPGFETDS